MKVSKCIVMGFGPSVNEANLAIVYTGYTNSPLQPSACHHYKKKEVRKTNIPHH